MAFRVAWISDDRYRSTMGVIVTCMGILLSAGDNYGCIWERLGALATSLVTATSSLGAPKTSVRADGSADEKPGCTDNVHGRAGDKSVCTLHQSRAVWDKQHHLWECCWCAWKS